MLQANEMLRKVLALAFETESEELLQICEVFETADNSWEVQRTLVNKVAAQEAYKTLLAAYRLHFEV